MKPLYWRKFVSREWTRTHFVQDGMVNAICGEPVNNQAMREDDRLEERNCCKKCWRMATDAEKARCLEIYS